MEKLFYYILTEKQEIKQDIKPELFTKMKIELAAHAYADAHSKLTAYSYLREHDFDVPKDHEIWRTIDEPYEYYQQFAKKLQQEVRPQVDNQNQ